MRDVDSLTTKSGFATRQRVAGPRWDDVRNNSCFLLRGFHKYPGTVRVLPTGTKYRYWCGDTELLLPVIFVCELGQHKQTN